MNPDALQTIRELNTWLAALDAVLAGAQACPQGVDPYMFSHYKRAPNRGKILEDHMDQLQSARGTLMVDVIAGMNEDRAALDAVLAGAAACPEGVSPTLFSRYKHLPNPAKVLAELMSALPLALGKQPPAPTVEAKVSLRGRLLVSKLEWNTSLAARVLGLDDKRKQTK